MGWRALAVALAGTSLSSMTGHRAVRSAAKAGSCTLADEAPSASPNADAVGEFVSKRGCEAFSGYDEVAGGYLSAEGGWDCPRFR